MTVPIKLLTMSRKSGRVICVINGNGIIPNASSTIYDDPVTRLESSMIRKTIVTSSVRREWRFFTFWPPPCIQARER